MGRKTILILAVGAFIGAFVALSSVAQEFVPEGNWAGTNWQVGGPAETVAIPVTVSEESWMKEYGND